MNIALIAHDKKKELMASFCIAYRSILKNHTLFATGTTGAIIVEATGLNVHRFLPGVMENSRLVPEQPIMSWTWLFSSEIPLAPNLMNRIYILY